MTEWQIKCSSCGQDVILSSHIHLPNTLKCPNCNADVTATRT
jgi:DNA-directed RNA polymerase subunit RPC12/RpoP